MPHPYIPIIFKKLTYLSQNFPQCTAAFSWLSRLLNADCSRLVCDSYGPVLYVCGAAFCYAFRWYSTINTCLLNGKLQTLNARTPTHTQFPIRTKKSVCVPGRVFVLVLSGVGGHSDVLICCQYASNI